MNTKARTSQQIRKIPFTPQNKAEKEIQEIGSCIKEQEEDLKWYLLHGDELKEDLAQLEAEIEVVTQPLLQTKESVDAVYRIASRNKSFKDRHPEFSTDVIGVVALLATGPDSRLRRKFDRDFVIEGDHSQRKGVLNTQYLQEMRL